MTSQTNKLAKNKVHGINNLLYCSISTGYFVWSQMATKRKILMFNSENPNIKWSIKPSIVRPKHLHIEFGEEVLY